MTFTTRRTTQFNSSRERQLQRSIALEKQPVGMPFKSPLLQLDENKPRVAHQKKLTLLIQLLGGIPQTPAIKSAKEMVAGSTQKKVSLANTIKMMDIDSSCGRWSKLTSHVISFCGLRTKEGTGRGRGHSNHCR